LHAHYQDVACIQRSSQAFVFKALAHPGCLDARRICRKPRNASANSPPWSDPKCPPFLAWIASSPRDVRVQHFSPSGTPQWAAEGLIVPNVDSLETDPAILADGSGGIFVNFDTISFGVRGQRLDNSGTAQWFDGGNIGLHLGVGDDPIGQGSTV
jgi:hypothetical protein